MSIPYSGTLARSGGLISAISKQLRSVNLKPVKQIQVQFDPFHSNAVTVRDFLFYVSAPNIQNTNLGCRIKANVVCDRSEPFVQVNLQDSKKIKLLCNNLTVLELLQIFNRNVSCLVKKEEPTEQQSVKSTKGKKKR